MLAQCLVFVVLVFVGHVYSDDCVTYSFENGFEDVFNFDQGVCASLQQNWEAVKLSTTDIDPFNAQSETCISPSIDLLSCVTSFVFPMTEGGVIEINVFMTDEVVTSSITVIVYAIVPDGNDLVVGNLVLNPMSAGFVNGWQTLKINVIGTLASDGYITFMGMKSENTAVFIDSFRYIPPGMDENECQIYTEDITLEPTTPSPELTVSTLEPTDLTSDSDSTTADPEYTATTTDYTTPILDLTTEYEELSTPIPELTESTPESTYPYPELSSSTMEPTATSSDESTFEPNTQSTTITPTTEEIEEDQECITFNFESDFDTQFTDDNYLCEGLLTWHLENYTSVPIESPDPRSTVFIAPKETTSCIASSVFRMAPNGVVEVNVYMDPISSVDHIIILAKQVTDKDYDTAAGFKMYYPENEAFDIGWNVLRFSLIGFRNFDGYLMFLGGAEYGSTVLVDSVRYIPPNLSSDDESCSLY